MGFERKREGRYERKGEEIRDDIGTVRETQRRGIEKGNDM